jgi:hypothetical protein
MQFVRALPTPWQSKITTHFQITVRSCRLVLVVQLSSLRASIKISTNPRKKASHQLDATFLRFARRIGATCISACENRGSGNMAMHPINNDHMNSLDVGHEVLHVQLLGTTTSVWVGQISRKRIQGEL